MKKIIEKYDWQAIVSPNIVGVDEVGRGCLAGPVYAAAVILNEKKDFSLYTDSKTLSEKRRSLLSEHIKSNHQWCVGIASIEEISELNILHASLLAMQRAVEGLGVESGHVLVDGNKRITHLANSFKQTTLVKGDLRASPVAAASIIAKVARDNWMVEQSEVFTQYSFEKHKGYCTKAHKEAIEKFGPCKLHRPTFSGVKEYL